MASEVTHLVASSITLNAETSSVGGIAIVSPESADDCLAICRNHPLGGDACIIGQVVETRDIPTVELITRIGGRRIVQMPYGRELPRIC